MRRLQRQESPARTCCRQLFLYFGFAELGVAHFCALLTKQLHKQRDKSGETKTNALETRDLPKEMLACIETEKNRLHRFREAIAQMEESVKAAILQSYRLPDPAALEQIVHYESHLLRQLSRAYAQLERLQSLRAGESLALPLTARLDLG
jgi:hypothetical protein